MVFGWGQIGRLFGLHQANITRQLGRVQAKIRQSFESTLIHKYKLGQAAIDECLSEIAENPAYSILDLIKIIGGAVTALIVYIGYRRSKK
jgi:hypothetical protein